MVVRISDQQKQKLEERAISGVRRFAAIGFYLWVLLSLLEIHRFARLEGSPRDFDFRLQIGLRGKLMRLCWENSSYLPKTSISENESMKSAF
jgi:hypothetical protein